MKIRESMKGKAGEEEEPVLLALPPKGTPSKQVMARMRTRVRPDPPRPCSPTHTVCWHMCPHYLKAEHCWNC